LQVISPISQTGRTLSTLHVAAVIKACTPHMPRDAPPLDNPSVPSSPHVRLYIPADPVVVSDLDDAAQSQKADGSAGGARSVADELEGLAREHQLRPGGEHDQDAASALPRVAGPTGHAVPLARRVEVLRRLEASMRDNGMRHTTLTLATLLRAWAAMGARAEVRAAWRRHVIDGGVAPDSTAASLAAAAWWREIVRLTEDDLPLHAGMVGEHIRDALEADDSGNNGNGNAGNNGNGSGNNGIGSGNNGIGSDNGNNGIGSDNKTNGPMASRTAQHRGHRLWRARGDWPTASALHRELLRHHRFVAELHPRMRLRRAYFIMLLDSCARFGDAAGARALLAEMRAHGVLPCAAALALAARALADRLCLEEARALRT
jgi:hypothetical protein